MTQNCTDFSLKIAENAEELRAVQRLRYRVFVEELGGQTDAKSAELGLERDVYDTYFDHLILKDKSLPDKNNVVGAYRLLRGELVNANRRFYSASEFDLTKIINSNRKSAELGRSCVDVRYRNGIAMHFLWNGLADYVMDHGIEVLFGVASFHGTNLSTISQALSYLHYNHLADDALRVTATGKNSVALNILQQEQVDRREAMLQIPTLIKSYLRLGGAVGSGAYIDHQFNTTDVCMVMDTARMAQKYKAFYSRETAA